MKKFLILIFVLICSLGIFMCYLFYNKIDINTNLDDDSEMIVPSIYDAYNEEEMSFLNNLMGLTYYDETKIDRYLKYMDNEQYNYEEIIRVVNTNNDLEYFNDAVGANISDDILILVNKYNYLSSDYEPNDLEVVDTNYSYWGSLRSEAALAFSEMVTVASQEGLKIINTSPYRSWELQNALYNNYVNSDGVKAADRYSARPGYSEHQTGLAVDVLTPTSNLDTFKNTKEFIWMQENSYKYGFILRYKAGMEYITGYMYEPWHYRYVGIEAAKTIYEEDLTFEEYYYYYVKK